MQARSARTLARDQRIGWAAVLGGLALALAAQVAGPVGVPLYDGVVVQEPYRFLQPTGDQSGSPSSFSATFEVIGTRSPGFVAATTEVPPQAQLVTQDGAFELTAGATELLIQISPIEPPPVTPGEPGEPGTEIAGNVYRFTVTDQSGTPLSIAPCDGCMALSMRGPEGTENGRLLRFAGGEWTDVDAIHVAMTGMYSWTATALGDFAVVSSAAGDGGLDPLLIVVGGAVVVLILAIAGVLALRRPREGGGGPARVARGGSAGAGGPPRVRATGMSSKRKPNRPPKQPPEPPTKRSQP